MADMATCVTEAESARKKRIQDKGEGDARDTKKASANPKKATSIEIRQAKAKTHHQPNVCAGIVLSLLRLHVTIQ